MLKTLAVVLVMTTVGSAKYIPQASESEPVAMASSAVPEIQSASSYGYAPSTSYSEPSYPPQPYSYGYETTDSYGTTVKREESGDGIGAVKGSYTISTSNGLTRTVDYVADAYGFRATVRSNEPGVQRSKPADVVVDGPQVAYGSTITQSAPRRY